MAKNISLFICAICFYVSVLGFSGADSVRAEYSKYIGVRELTGKNDGPEVQGFLKYGCNLSGNYAWCACFTAAVLKYCGYEVPSKPAWSPNWFHKNIISIDVAMHGDVFGIYFTSKKRIAHVGFIDKVQDDYVITVEGNTNEAGSREGDGVYKKRRLKRQIYKVSRWI